MSIKSRAWKLFWEKTASNSLKARGNFFIKEVLYQINKFLLKMKETESSDDVKFGKDRQAQFNK